MSRRSARPISTTIVGPSPSATTKLPPFARKNIAKTPLVGGQWRLRDNGKYEIVIVDNQTAPNIPTGGKMEAICLKLRCEVA